MTVSAIRELGLKPAQLRALDQRAKTRGQTTGQYIRFLIERDLLASQSFDEILAPVRADFRRKGITGQQLDAIVGRARGASRKRRGSTP